MDKFEVAIEMIRRAEHESKRLIALEKALNKAREEPDFNWQKRMRIEERFSPIPHKSVVNDSLKMARQLLKEEYI